MEKNTDVTVTFHFTADLERRIDDFARSRGLSRSDVVRDALERFLQEGERTQKSTLYEQLKPWIGIVDSRGKYPAKDHKKHVASFIDEKHHARRTR